MSAPKELRGVAVVCPALDLSACADALEEKQNYLYQWHFVRGLMERYRRKCELFPGRYTQTGFGAIRTVREFDDAITAPCFGYKDAEEYYEAAGAKKVIGKVAVPLLLITAQDDPFVPYVSFLADAGGGKSARAVCGAGTRGTLRVYFEIWTGRRGFGRRRGLWSLSRGLAGG